MSRRSRVIRFPQDRTRAERERRQRVAIEQRVQALPESIRELDVAWIFEAAEKGKSGTRA